ncbi:ribonuclease E/G [Hyphomonas sp.]|uniref:ribonuclease E/G n=1 Tax=Hyphomonas sp. TaxID=87 RepID=UPI00391B1E81
MPVARILREQAIGQTRWVALDTGGRPAALYLERETNPDRLGARFEARVAAKDTGAGGCFVELEGAGQAFLRTSARTPDLNEGQLVTVRIAAEAREEKLARAELADPGAAGAPAGGAAWRLLLAGGADAPVEDVPPGDPVVGEAFEDAMVPDVTLPGGGRLRLDRTRALTAADIDTSGRNSRGTAAARALSVNRGAAADLARQCLLRGLGGLIVLDCVAPVTRGSGADVRQAFLDTWSALSLLPPRALPPSALGLMEVSLPWRQTPLTDHMATANGPPLPEALALEGLRLLEHTAAQARLGRLTLGLPEASYRWLAASGIGAEQRLAEKYGARLSIRVHAKPAPEVWPEP